MKLSKLRLSVAVGLGVISSLHAAEPVNLSSSLVQRHPSSLAMKPSEGLLQTLKLNDRYLFKQQSVITDAKGNTHTRYQQTYLGVPVWAQNVTTHLRKISGMEKLSGQYLKGIESDIGSTITTKLNASEAVTFAKRSANKELGELNSFTRENSTLYIDRDSFTKKAHLIYHVELMATDKKGMLVRRMYLINAQNGDVEKSWNALMHIDVTGPGGNEKTGEYHFGTDYAALDATDDGNGRCYLENDNVKAINLNHTYDTSFSTVFEFGCSENEFKEINGAFSPINDAYFFGNLSFDMFNDWYGIAPLPFQLTMKVHFGANYENAFWDGQSMTFGDGYSRFYPLVDVNVSVHEVSHGFTEFNSDLIYSNESGGINEAFSDIAGEAAEYYWRGEVDWFVGKDIFKDGDGLRYFEDPTLDNRSIGHYDNYYNGLNVHYSSGIFNRAYFLLSNMPGWDPKKAFDVFVLANQAYWVADETFENGSCGVIAAASDLDYSWFDVYAAMLEVGVECSGNGVDGDEDGMSDIQELIIGFDPNDAEDAKLDFDGDGILNRVELIKGFNPKDRDSDNDGLNDDVELLELGTDVLLIDSDGDNMPDGFEVENGLDPLNDKDANEDADNDGTINYKEYLDGTDLNDENDFKWTELLNFVSFENGSLAPGMTSISSNPIFVIDDSTASDGVYSLKSGEIGHYHSSIVVWDIYSDEGQFEFDLKTSTERGFDRFSLYIDGILAYRRSGIFDWERISVPINTGAHQVQFVYSKDGSVNRGEDAVWVDNIYYGGLEIDLDNDDILDKWEVFYGLDPMNAEDAGLDLDGDGLTNLEEYQLGTDPTALDSDEDSIDDFIEVNEHQTNPALSDSDDDGLPDATEIQLELDPLDAADGESDLDDDGFSNRLEFVNNTQLDDANSIPHLLTMFRGSVAQMESQWYSHETYSKSWGIELNRDGQSVLMAEPISNNSSATIHFYDVFDEGQFSFTLTADTQIDRDIVYVLVDGVIHSTYSGIVKNEHVVIDLSRGEHEIRLSYVKDSVTSSIVDRVSIENVQFVSPNADSDNDGLTNGDEINVHGTNPLMSDTDNDGLSDSEEISRGTNPLKADSDGDGVVDGQDFYPNNANRWNESSGGGLGVTLFLIVLLGARRRFL